MSWESLAAGLHKTTTPRAADCLGMYSAYMNEREGVSTIATDVGFVTYHANTSKNKGVIIDIYVKPEHRRSKNATKLAEAAIEALQSKGITEILGIVDTKDQNISRSEQLLAACDFHKLPEKLNLEITIYRKGLN